MMKKDYLGPSIKVVRVLQNTYLLNLKFFRIIFRIMSYKYIKNRWNKKINVPQDYYIFQLN